MADVKASFEAARDLHRAAILLLRRARFDDESFGLSAARLSALSVLVFGGPIALGRLARLEQVKPPTMTRLIQGLERQGFVTRSRDEGDRRVWNIEATAKGKRLLHAARDRRVEHLVAALDPLDDRELEIVRRASALLLGALEPTSHESLE